MNSQRSLLAIAIAVSLSACGGGGSSSDSGSGSNTDSATGTDATTSFTARAADGYLYGANACLDLNGNKACDDDEPSAVTDENGEFTLTGVTQAQIENGVVVIEVIAGQTIDQDNPGVPLTKPYTLTAPPGSAFISPLTTLVQSEIEKGHTLEAATLAIKTKLGSELDLDRDYVAAQASDALTEQQRAAYAELHRVAQVTASVLAKATSELDAATGGIEEDELKELIIEHVSKVLEQVLGQIAGASDELDADDIAELISVGLSNENLRDELQEFEAEKDAQVVNVVEVLKTHGLGWFYGQEVEEEPYELTYGVIKLDQNDAVSEQSFSYDYQQQSFIAVSDDTVDENQMILSANGWAEENDQIVAFTTNDDNSVIAQRSIPELNEKLSAERIDIGGLKVHGILEEVDEGGAWENVVPADLVFPADAAAYKLSVELVSGGYYSFNKGDWCKDGTPERYTTLGNMCNGISVYTNSGDVWLQTLASTIAADASDRSNTMNTVDLIPMAGLDKGMVYAQLKPNGEIVYYSMRWEEDNNLHSYAEKGAWKDIQHHGQTLREMTLPESVQNEVAWSNFNSEDGKLYLAEYGGYLRVTWYTEEDEESLYLFDEATAQFVAGSHSQPLNLQACLDSLSDAGYKRSVGDVWVQNVQRSVPWVNEGKPTDFQYKLEYKGSNFSWLNGDEINVSGLPTQLAAGNLSQILVTGFDQDGTKLFVEEQYENQDHYFGQYGYDDYGNRWGRVKVVLPAPVAKSSVVLGQNVVHQDAAVASLTQITQAQPGTTVDQLQSEYFTYTQKFIGKRTVEVESGEYDVCHVVNQSAWGAGAANNVTDVSTVWLNNRGVVKQFRNEPSWSAVLSIEAKTLPAYN